MAKPYHRTLFIQLLFLFLIVSPSFASRSVQLIVTPGSGMAPLEVDFRCYNTDGTSPSRSYIMDFGDESELETVQSNKFSQSFTHTYSSGYFKPVCTIKKINGSNVESDPGRVIVAKWRFETAGDIDTSPAIGEDGTVYVGSEDGNLYAIDPETGDEIWRFPAGGEILSSPSIGVDGTIYFGVLNSLFAVKPNGSRKWSFDVGDYIFSSPALSTDGRVIYVGSSNGILYAITATGTIKWQFQTGDKITSSPAIGYDGIEEVVYVGSQDRHVYAVAADNGALKWQFKTNREVYGSPAIGSDGAIYVGECEVDRAATYDFKFYCINVDGSKRWEIDGGTGFYSSPAIGFDTIIFVGSWDGYLVAIKSGGTIDWSVQTNPPSDINSSPAVGANDVVYVGSKDGNFYAYQSPAVDDDNRRQDWVFETDDIIRSSPVISEDGTIYFGSRDNHLYAVNPGNLLPNSGAWPMFQGNAAHTGALENVEIPEVISTRPANKSTDVDIQISEIKVNFSPLVETSQVDIDSFALKKVTQSGKEDVEGFSVLDFERYNNSGYHVAALFKRFNNAEPLEYGTEYQGTINYSENAAIDESEEVIYDKTFSWSFITETEPEEDGKGSGGKVGCFISTVYDRKERY